MLTAAAVITLLVVTAAALFTTTIVKMRKPSHGTHSYMPATNPFRIGATVLVCEDPARPDMNFYGTVLSTAGGMLTVRDTSAPYASVQLGRDAVYPADTNLGW